MDKDKDKSMALASSQNCLNWNNQLFSSNSWRKMVTVMGSWAVDPTTSLSPLFGKSVNEQRRRFAFGEF